jgi:hypothetical protein
MSFSVQTCPVGKIYNQAASACPATCRDPDAPRDCQLAEVPGCTCPDGMLADQGDCLFPDQCHCRDQPGHVFKVETPDVIGKVDNNLGPVAIVLYWIVGSNPGLCLGRLSSRIVHVRTTGRHMCTKVA